MRFKHQAALCSAFLCVGSSLARAAETPESDHEHVESIVVTVSPLARAADELAVPVTVVDREHLLEHVGSTLGETLELEPGITTSGFAPGASRPIIRGQNDFRVRILENGIGTHDVSVLSADHGLPINPLAQQRIEVVRGPATLRYGGGAIAGVVNAINDRVPRSLPDRAIGGEVLAVYGYNGNQRDAGFLLDGGAGSFAWHVDAVSRDSTDFDLPDDPGEEPFSDTDGYSMSAGAAWVGEGGRLGFSVARFANEYGIPAPAGDPLSIDLERERYALEADWRTPLRGVDSIVLRAALTDYDHAEIENGVEVGSTFDNREWELRAEALHTPLGRFSGALGLHLMHRDLEASGEGSELLAPSDTRGWALYLLESIELAERTMLEIGARVENTRLEGTGFDERKRTREFHPLSGSLGLVFRPSDESSVGLTLSGTQRAPDTLELFARGPHEATETFEIGDPGLDEETSLSADLSLRLRRERWSAEWSLFYTRYEHFIFGSFSGRRVDEDGNPDPGGLLELLYARNDATFYGTELSGHLDLMQHRGGVLGLDALFDFVRARLDDGNVPRIPPIRWGAGVYYSHPRLALRLGFHRAEKQERLGDLETETGAYTFLNASLSVPLGDSGLELSITGTNLLDEKARNHVSFKKGDVVLPGRGVRIGVRGVF
jgi:iron complex outermembrane receptor protein